MSEPVEKISGLLAGMAETFDDFSQRFDDKVDGGFTTIATELRMVARIAARQERELEDFRAILGSGGQMRRAGERLQ